MKCLRVQRSSLTHWRRVKPSQLYLYLCFSPLGIYNCCDSVLGESQSQTCKLFFHQKTCIRFLTQVSRTSFSYVCYIEPISQFQIFEFSIVTCVLMPYLKSFFIQRISDLLTSPCSCDVRYEQLMILHIHFTSFVKLWRSCPQGTGRQTDRLGLEALGVI